MIDKIVEALKSGEYTQGNAFAKETIGGKPFHTLAGVLCEVAMKNGVKFDIEKHFLCKNEYYYTFDGERFFAPKRLVDWLGEDYKILLPILFEDFNLSFDDMAKHLEYVTI